MIEYPIPGDPDPYLDEVINHFKTRTGLSEVDWEVKERLLGNYLMFYLANPTERFFRLLNETHASLSEGHPYYERATLIRRPAPPKDRLNLPEVHLLRTVLSESLMATHHSFQEDFFTRYIRSVFGAEEQIIANNNHIVFGRRGAGKTSLLAYFLHKLRQQGAPYAWVAMQAYAGRKDPHVIVDVFLDIVQQLHTRNPNYSELDPIIRQLNYLTEVESDPSHQLDRLLPRIRRTIFPLAEKHNRIVIFLDDLHVIHTDLQPILLAKLYSICRDNKAFLKISGIEQFTNNWEASSRHGLETPHDAQVIRLDYNLTIPDQSKTHIQNILDAHAIYCGLPGVSYICGKGVLDRLVWVAAAVPRDALNIFAQAIAYSTVKNQKKVSITSINAAVSEMAEEKIKYIDTDALGQYDAVRSVLENVRQFCVNDKRKNAFLVEIQNDNPTFNRIKELEALRLFHVLHEAFTPREAGHRFMALMLDYGFYVGIRAARSVDLFQKEPKPLLAKELRKLPIFQLPNQ